MKYLLCAADVVSSSFLAVAAQVTNPTPAQTRPRVIVVGSNPTPTPSNTVIVTNTRPIPAQSPIVIGNSNTSSNVSATILTLAQIRQKLAEAKREMSARPITIAMTEGVSPVSPLEMVRVAFYDVETRQIDYLALSKNAFLTKDPEYVLST